MKAPAKGLYHGLFIQPGNQYYLLEIVGEDLVTVQQASLQGHVVTMVGVQNIPLAFFNGLVIELPVIII